MNVACDGTVFGVLLTASANTWTGSRRQRREQARIGAGECVSAAPQASAPRFRAVLMVGPDSGARALALGLLDPSSAGEEFHSFGAVFKKAVNQRLREAGIIGPARDDLP